MNYAHLFLGLLIFFTMSLFTLIWFAVLCSDKARPLPTTLDIRRAELQEAERILFSAFTYLKERQFCFSTPNDAGQLLLNKTRDVSDAIDALDRYGLPEEYEQQRTLDKEFSKVFWQDRRVSKALLEQPAAISQADREGEENILFCTRSAPHVCTANGPCNGYPKEEGLNPVMELKEF